MRDHGLDYPLIVHLHAVAFVGWLTLFTAQVALIRGNRVDLHRRLGAAGALLAALMVVIGPATALIVDRVHFEATGETPEFLAVQFTDILTFAVLTGAGLLLRARRTAHKRLMLLGLFYISNAGFARFLNGLAAAPLDPGPLGGIAHMYFGGDLLVLALGVYDLATSRRLHPAYLAGVAWIVTIEALAVVLLISPWWKALALRLIGH